MIGKLLINDYELQKVKIADSFEPNGQLISDNDYYVVSLFSNWSVGTNSLSGSTFRLKLRD